MKMLRCLSRVTRKYEEIIIQEESMEIAPIGENKIELVRTCFLECKVTEKLKARQEMAVYIVDGERQDQKSGGIRCDTERYEHVWCTRRCGRSTKVN